MHASAVSSAVLTVKETPLTTIDPLYVKNGAKSFGALMRNNQEP